MPFLHNRFYSFLFISIRFHFFAYIFIIISIDFHIFHLSFNYFYIFPTIFIQVFSYYSIYISDFDYFHLLPFVSITNISRIYLFLSKNIKSFNLNAILTFQKYWKQNFFEFAKKNTQIYYFKKRNFMTFIFQKILLGQISLIIYTKKKGDIPFWMKLETQIISVGYNCSLSFINFVRNFAIC